MNLDLDSEMRWLLKHKASSWHRNTNGVSIDSFGDFLVEDVTLAEAKLLKKSLEGLRVVTINIAPKSSELKCDGVVLFGFLGVIYDNGRYYFTLNKVTSKLWSAENKRWRHQSLYLDPEEPIEDELRAQIVAMANSENGRLWLDCDPADIPDDLD